MADGGGAAPVAVGDSPGIFQPKRKSVFVRDMQVGEADLLGAVFFRSVHHGAARAYSEAEREAWAPQAPVGEAWAARLSGQATVVAEVDGRVRGFMAMSLETGHLDLAYLEKGAQGCGAAEAMYLVLENRARSAGLRRIEAQASYLAKPFLKRLGWVILSGQTVEHRGVPLQNWRMEKALS